MKNTADIQSEYYQPIQWSRLFGKVCDRFLNGNENIILINSQGIIATTDNLSSLEKIKVLSENDKVQFYFNHHQHLPQSFLALPDMKFYRLDNYYFPHDRLSDEYLNFLSSLLSQIYSATENVFQYTYDHLSHRKYSGKEIHTIDAVNSEFIEVLMLFDQLMCASTSKNSIQEISAKLSLFISIFTKLARLGGARAVLKNNALDLLFYLKVFQKFIEG